MEFSSVVQMSRRMCAHFMNNRECYNCPLGNYRNKPKMLCDAFMSTYPEEYEKIVCEWALAHDTTLRENIRFVLEQSVCKDHADKLCDMLMDDIFADVTASSSYEKDGNCSNIDIRHSIGRVLCSHLNLE